MVEGEPCGSRVASGLDVEEEAGNSAHLYAPTLDT